MLSIYLGISGFLGIFTIVYYHFSHGVTSPYMTFLFAIPLVAGCVSFILKKWFGPGNAVSRNAYPSGIAALVMACMLKAIFDIAGNSSVFVPPLFLMGGGLLSIGAVSYFFRREAMR